MGSQVLQLLLGRHCDAALGAGHNHGLGDFRDGEFGFEFGGGGEGGADAGDDFVVHPCLFEDPHLFEDGAVQGRVAALDAGYGLAGGGGLEGDGHNLVEGEVAAAVDGGVGPGIGDDVRVDEGIGVDDYIGGGDEPLGFEGEQFGVAGAAADEIDFTVGHFFTF